MAQGFKKFKPAPLKRVKANSRSTTHPGASGSLKVTKKGARIVQPKNKMASQHLLLQKKLTSKINASLEETLASRAGNKLTLIRHKAPQAEHKKITKMEKKIAKASNEASSMSF